MNKFFISGCVASMLFFVGNVNAQTYAEVQKPSSDTPWSIEIQTGASALMNIIGGTTSTKINGLNWGSTSIRARYFLSDDWAVRAQLGLGDGSGDALHEEHEYYANAPALNGNTGATAVKTIDRAAVTLQLGIEKHFAGTEKLDPYAAFGINLGLGNQTVEGKRVTWDAANNEVGASYDATQYSSKTNGGYYAYGATLGLGTDFYFVENVYLGMEIGISYNGFKYKEGTIHRNTKAAVINIKSPGHAESYVGTHAMFRLGWRF